MRRGVIALTAVLLTSLGAVRFAQAHCEVPCGIYDDQLRFQQMLEDAATIEKAMGQIGELAEKHGAQELNQLVRWVDTKEHHATATQQVIAQYFMTQRIKTKDQTYIKRLTAAHAVLQAAMKCKQTTDPANAKALRKTILAFHKIYEGS